MQSLKKQSAGMRLEILNVIKGCLVDERPTNFTQCVMWARLKFEELFNNNIQQLLYNFPRDMITSTGSMFARKTHKQASELTIFFQLLSGLDPREHLPQSSSTQMNNYIWTSSSLLPNSALSTTESRVKYLIDRSTDL